MGKIVFEQDLWITSVHVGLSNLGWDFSWSKKLKRKFSEPFNIPLNQKINWDRNPWNLESKLLPMKQIYSRQNFLVETQPMRALYLEST